MGLKLMCVVAHPDDECFAFGGALALAADRGVTTYVVCLTDGQAATNRGEAASGEELGRMRRAEFVASCDILGVSEHELMDYSDGQMEFVDFSSAVARLVKRIRRFRPDVVLTFGADGALNTHVDHTVTSMLATAGFHWSGREKRYPELGAVFQPRRLFHLSTNFFMPDRQTPLPVPWTVRLDIGAVRERKSEAFRAHASQAPLMERTRELFARYGGEEFYTLMASAEAEPARQITDLFEGLLLD